MTLAPALSSASKIAATARSGIDRDGLALKLAQESLELRPVVQPNPIAEMLAKLGIDLFLGDEQVGRAVGVNQGESERDRRAGDILAADIERPGDRIERGQDRRVGAFFREPIGDIVPFLG